MVASFTPHARETPQTFHSASVRTVRLVAWGSTSIFAALFATLSLVRHARLLTTGFDLGIFEQSVRSYAEGRPPTSLLKGVDYPLLGDHFSPIVALLGPIYAMFPGVEVLLIGQAMLLAVGVVPLVFWAARELRTTATIVVALSYGLAGGSVKHASTSSPPDNAASTPSRLFFELQRSQPIEPGRIATTWAEVALHRDLDMPIGRNSLPAALRHAVTSGVLTDPVEIAVGLNDAWTGCEWPTAYLSPDKWAQLFDRVGFVADGQQAPRPDHAVTVYRAAADGFVRGMSWTDDLQVALWFHRRNLSAGLDSGVYTASFGPQDLLGFFNYSTGEHEWVLRPTATAEHLERLDTSNLPHPESPPPGRSR